MNFSPKTEANAFRIWAAAQPYEWNVTVNQLAFLTDLSPSIVIRTCQLKHWLPRLRQEKPALAGCGKGNRYRKDPLNVAMASSFLGRPITFTGDEQ